MKFVPCSARCPVIGVMLCTLLAAQPTAAQDTRGGERRSAERDVEARERRDESERANTRRAARRARAQRDSEDRAEAREQRDRAREQRDHVREQRKDSERRLQRERREAQKRARDAARSEPRDASGTKPERARKKRDDERPRAVRAESVVAAPTPSEGDASDIVREGDTSVKVMRFSGLDIEGRLKSPQLMVFVERVRAEFERPRLPHRSFIPELVDSAREPVR